MRIGADKSETGPTLHTHQGRPSIIKTTISIAEYLELRRIQEAFEGDLTDNESDSDDGDAPGSEWADDTDDGDSDESDSGTESESKRTSPYPPTRKGRQKERYARIRREKRRRRQDEMQTDIKAVVQQRVLDSTRDAIQVDFSLETDARVSKSGWIGRQLKGLLLENPDLRAILEDDEMVYLPWDGRYVFNSKALYRLTYLLQPNPSSCRQRAARFWRPLWKAPKAQLAACA